MIVSVNPEALSKNGCMPPILTGDNGENREFSSVPIIADARDCWTDLNKTVAAVATTLRAVFLV
jgi:hypothetical protein